MNKLFATPVAAIMPVGVISCGRSSNGFGLMCAPSSLLGDDVFAIE